MSVLADQIASTLWPGMVVPGPLIQLFDWIEVNGFYNDTYEGRYGVLYDDELNPPDTEEEQFGGTDITFSAENSTGYLEKLLGHSRTEVLQRLCVFALTGMDGSHAAFWLDERGQQRIVHIGSGSGSGLLCVLTDDPVDFLRLIAIGYREICWAELYPYTPNGNDPDTITHPNVDYQQWVCDSFDVSIPETALEIVKTPARMHDSESDDEFWQWFMMNSA